MAIEIMVPRLGWSMEEGAFVAWLKRDGEFVRAGEALFSIEGDKAQQEIESIDSGILRIAPNAPKKPGDPVRVGDILGYLVAPETTPSDSPPPTATLAPPVAKPAGNDLAGVPQRPIGASVAVSSPAAPPSNTPAISPRALRVAIELGLDWTTVSGTGRTGRIRERDIRKARREEQTDGR